jgi:hypothetical protein
VAFTVIDAKHGMNQHHYRHLFIMTMLSFASMYVLMYAMVNAFDNVYASVNQVYMAGLMTAPMVVIELVVMRRMYQDERRNVLILGAAVVTGVVLLAFIRWQTGGLRQAVPTLDDPAPRRGDSDVSRGADTGLRNQEPVQQHSQEPAGRDRPNEIEAAAVEPVSDVASSLLSCSGLEMLVLASYTNANVASNRRLSETADIGPAAESVPC